MSTGVRILEPGQMETPKGEIRFLFLPDRDLFARRAERLRYLSKDHLWGDYLNFLAILSDAQQDALNQFPALPLPGPDAQALYRERGMPLLDSLSRPRNPAWRRALNTILEQMNKGAFPPAALETVARLMHASDATLEETADRVLSGDFAAVSPQEMPLVAAALQVYWVHMASSMREHALGRSKQGGSCPVCGSHPSVGIVRGGAQGQGLRYLSCSLCASEWNMVRLKCSNCESTEGIDYYTLESSAGAVKAESCGACNSYLKLIYLSKDLRMEAMADDLATLNLDILMDEKGKARRGPNLFFHPGRSHWHDRI
ncbi:MAG TPA: formate dehydrogenase accessory protein FdhE [Nitrospirota bacterium]|nr:formate dehydrogenase accessory protein FdhE [Nitrospirota bacterium]